MAFLNITTFRYVFEPDELENYFHHYEQTNKFVSITMRDSGHTENSGQAIVSSD